MRRVRALGVLLHLANQAVRGRGWYAIVRAREPATTRRCAAATRSSPGSRAPGAGGVVSARGGDVVRVLLLSRRARDTRSSVLAGTLVAEAAGDALVGAAVIGLAMALGAAPAFGLPGTETLAWAGGGARRCSPSLAFVAAPPRRPRGADRRRRRPRLRPARASGAPSRAACCRGRPARARCAAAAIACFLLAFSLPAGVAAVLLVMLAQSGGRLLPLAPASAAASVAMLAAGFGPATGTAVAREPRSPRSWSA